MSINELAHGGARRSTGVIAGFTVAVVVVVGAFFAWRTFSSSASRPAASAGSPAGAVAPPSALGPVLEAVALQPTDLRGGFSTRLIPEGDQVAGQVTLDNCGYAFTTEAHRVARRQYELVDGTGQDAGVGNEVVAYDQPSNATLALQQWHQAALSCPNQPVTSSVAGVVPLTERIISDEVGSATLPVSANIVTVESISAPSIGTKYLITVLQVRGQILDAIYARQDRQPTSADLLGAEAFAAATGRHLTEVS